MYWVELRATVRRHGEPRLVPLDTVNQHTGFRSVFAYDDRTAEIIRASRGTQGLRHVPVFADTLFMDFDNGDPVEFREWLRASGLAYSEWDSGGRSVHFHIELQPVTGPWVPAAMKQWVQDHAPQADTSFYHAAGMYRLPGTFHHKNPGRCKTMVAQQSGSPLVLVPGPIEVPNFYLEIGEGDPDRFHTMLLGPAATGGRNRYAWQLAVTAAEAGIPFDEALTKVQWWNEQFCSPPLEPQIVNKQCTSAYRRVVTR